MTPHISEHLPPMARQALIEAAQIANAEDRIKAIDAATEYARASEPEKFRALDANGNALEPL